MTCLKPTIAVFTILVLLTSLLTACNPARTFDQVAWLQPFEMNDENVPRCLMIDDLLQNQLTVGMSRLEVTALLGEADYQDDSTESEDRSQQTSGYFLGRCNKYNIKQYKLQLVFNGQERLEQITQIHD
jgi:outer membrane protein assembly factor BamE (lipoprotein component of BamABCDE complex)